MKAVMYRSFSTTPVIEQVEDPVPETGGVVVEVRASGICLSDWHGWHGNDPDISLPHVPGHELAGVVAAVGKADTKWRLGDRVTVPFVGGCGKCPQCASGNHQVCDDQFQPGFTHWRSFAQYVSIHHADINLVRIPEPVNFVTAASLGCRFATSFRAVADQGGVTAGQWVAVHGCGGVGLSAVMIASALGAKVVAIDISANALALARQLGAIVTIDARAETDVAQAVREITAGGAHVSLDALGSAVTSFNSIDNLRKRGRHIQVGLMVGDNALARVPLGKVMSNELEIYGSHGMQAYRYDVMLAMIASGKLSPEKLINRTVSLEDSIPVLTSMGEFRHSGVTVITEF